MRLLLKTEQGRGALREALSAIGWMLYMGTDDLFTLQPATEVA